MPDLNFKCVHFSYLTIRELYDVMALRQAVFIVEQNCPYLDADGKDLQSWHLMGFDDDKNLVAYTRLLPKGVSYENYASIGRVVSSADVRGQGAGKILMQESINQMKIIFPNEPVKISAQSYLLRFYESLGFESTGEFTILRPSNPLQQRIFRLLSFPRKSNVDKTSEQTIEQQADQ